ncbi:FAD-dependent oxidoreductase [Bacteroidota bacterium]
MEDLNLVGVCFHTVQNGHHESIKFPELVEYAKGFNNVAALWNSEEVILTDQDKLLQLLQKKNINRIVLAGIHPGFLKPLFSRFFNKLGIDPQNITICNFVEYNVLRDEDINSAKILLNCALNSMHINNFIGTKETKVNPDTLVIGGGIAGIQASLEIANGNQKVYLVEKSGTIGGHMATFDKTFPTLDCAACILTPKMVEVGQHKNIDLITYSEIQDVSGVPGNFKVKILKKARRVDITKCIGCGTCTEKCPSKTASEFDAGTTLRKAIYIPFPQAVPNKYLIDAENCTYVQKGKCGVCVKVCPVENCIDLDAKDETIEINVGNIIVATGFKIFDAKKTENFGYGKYPNVVTSLEFERLVNASGPTGGNIHLATIDKKGNRVFTSEGSVPKSLALIHCVGSRDENHNKYCSRVCCMYSLKLAHLIKEKIPDADVYEYYIDMRAFGKGYEEFYQRIKEEGIKMVRGRTAKIEKNENKLRLRSENILEGKIEEIDVDMVVLAVGLESTEDNRKIGDLLNIPYAKNGWLKEANSLDNPSETNEPGIFLAGTCQGPKDIPDTVAQASAAASHVLRSILSDTTTQHLKNLNYKEIENIIAQ